MVVLLRVAAPLAAGQPRHVCRAVSGIPARKIPAVPREGAEQECCGVASRLSFVYPGLPES